MRYKSMYAWFLVAAALLGAVNVANALDSSGVSAWVEGFNNKVRLIAGLFPASEGAHTLEPIAGVEIQMPPGWKTYWRAPGESGIPPEFEFAGSENIVTAQVLYPAPHRMSDKGGATIGYKDHVIFPVRVVPKDPGKPVLLKVKASFGVCKDICVPAEADLAIDIRPELAAAPEIQTIIENAMAAVPANDGPKLKAWSIKNEGGKPKLILDVEGASGPDADAFVDIADGTYLPLPAKLAGTGDAHSYQVDLTDGVDFKALKGKTIRVTLTGSEGNSETQIKIE